MSSLDVVIRQFEPEDRDSIRQICADTGFLGNPIDLIFSDREVFADMMTGYYLDKEPEHTFVAEADGEVVGYISRSLNKYLHYGMFLSSIIPTMRTVARFLTGKYRDHPQNRRFFRWLFTRLPFEMPDHPPNAACAHFNIEEGFRHQGIGTKLIETSLRTLYEEMRQREIETLYGEVFAHPKKTEQYFRDAGFDIYDKRTTTFFGDLIEGEVYLMCITKPLSKIEEMYELG